MTDDEAGGCCPIRGRFFRGECPAHEAGRQSLYNMIWLCVCFAEVSCSTRRIAPGFNMAKGETPGVMYSRRMSQQYYF